MKREIATERARAQVASLHDKMEDERGGGASVVEAAQKLGLTAVTIDAVDRSGRAPNGQPVTGIPQGLDVVSQAFSSDIGVDNDPMQFGGGYVWFDVLGITPSRERSLDEVKDQVEARWREDQITSRLRAKATEMVQKLDQGGKLADEAASLRTEGGDRARLQARRHRARPCRRRDRRSVSHSEGCSRASPGAPVGSDWIVFRVTDVTVPTLDPASEEIKKLKETLQRGLTDEQIARIRHQARNRDRHHHQSRRRRPGDRRQSNN